MDGVWQYVVVVWQRRSTRHLIKRVRFEQNVQSNPRTTPKKNKGIAERDKGIADRDDTIRELERQNAQLRETVANQEVWMEELRM